MKIGLINRYYPPYYSTTGRYANMMSEYLTTSLKAELHIFTQKGHYSADRTNSEHPVGKIHYVHKVIKARNIYLRLIFSFWASFILILNARWKACDFYIVMTDPPFNNFWASVLLKKKRYALWTMDLYPEAFEAKGLIKQDHLLNKFYKFILKTDIPEFVIALGPNQKAHILSYFPDVEAIFIPIGLTSINHRTVAPLWYKGDKLIIAYIGNIGEAHDEEFIIEYIKCMDDKTQHFVLSVYGTKSSDVVKAVSHFDHVSIVDYVTDEELSYIDLHLVTLKSAWTHICVPSKALYGLSSGAAIIFNGSPYSDTWQYVQKCGWIISENYKETGEIKNLVDGLSVDTINEKRKHIMCVLEDLERQKKQALQMISNKIKETYES